MKYIAIVFTFMLPHAAPMEQHFEYPSMEECQSFVKNTHKAWRSAPSAFLYKLECKGEKRVKEPEKSAIVEEA